MLDKTVQDQTARQASLENTIEMLTRELNEKKQVLQHEMSSAENQNKVETIANDDGQLICLDRLLLSLEMLVDYKGKQDELERTLSQMTQRLREHETAARVGETIARRSVLATSVLGK